MLSLVQILLWLGLVFLGLVIINTATNTYYNIENKKENFSWKKLLKGFMKSGMFYVGCSMMAMIFNLLPFINGLIISSYGVTLLAPDMLNYFSAATVLGAIMAVVIQQGKKAIQGISKLGQIKIDIQENIKTLEEIKSEESGE